MDTTWIMTQSNAGTAAADPALEAERIRRSREGDPRAFEELVRLHQHRVFRLAGRFFRERADVEDAAQETFLDAWRKLATYRGDAPFEHWLTRVCLNRCYARLRAARPEAPLDEAALERRGEAGPDPTAPVELERLLARLAPEDRFLLLLLEGEGWTTAEIAERLGWTRVNVKVRAHRARKRLRKLLETP